MQGIFSYPKDQRSNLDDKAKQCVFLGCGTEKFGYRFWDPVEKKVIRSRDALFLEDQIIEDFEKIEMSKLQDYMTLDRNPVVPSLEQHDDDVDGNGNEEEEHNHEDEAHEDVPVGDVEQEVQQQSEA